MIQVCIVPNSAPNAESTVFEIASLNRVPGTFREMVEVVSPFIPEGWHVVGRPDPEPYTGGWKRISAERYAEMLDILPPLDWTCPRFLVSEPISIRDGRSTYTAFVKIGGEFFESAAPLTRLEFRAVTDTEVLEAAR